MSGGRLPVFVSDQGNESTAGVSVPSNNDETTSSAPSASLSLADRLANWSEGMLRGPEGEVVSVFGFTPEEAQKVLFPVTRERGLPLDYRPRDLAPIPGGRSGVLVRAVVLPDLEAMLASALRLAVVSGFRSSSTQASLFDSRVRQRLAASAGALSLEDAREQTNAGTALPEHSQHQLGTAVDLSTPEVGYQITRAFIQTPAAYWLQEHAWEYGFVFPYTEAGRERTGYIAEPWHLRWIGRPLAAFLQSDGYLEGDLVADDYLEALERLLNE